MYVVTQKALQKKQASNPVIERVSFLKELRDSRAL